MNLKNSVLQDLYDTIFGGGTVTFTVDEESPIDKAFRECDDKLSDSVTFATIKDLQDRNDNLERVNEDLLAVNIKSVSKTRKLEKDLDNAKKNVEYFRDCRDNWRARAKHAEKEVEDLASQYQKLTIENKRLQDANATLEKANDDRTNLQEAVDKLSGENRSLNARIDCLRLEVEWYRNHYRDQYDKIRELKFRLNRGRTDLWNMLQNVNDAKPFELATCFPDVTCMDDILSWNLEDFLDAYESWQKKKEQERTKYFETWTCTLEGTINTEINKDLLNKICGIDSDD